MKILFISNLYPPNTVGGYEQLCFDMASALAGRGHQIFVLTSDYGGLGENYAGQNVDRSLRLLADGKDIYKPYGASAEERNGINIRNAEWLNRKLASVRPDVLFVWNLFFLDRSFLDAIHAAKCRTVFLITDNWLILFMKPEYWSGYYLKEISGGRSWKTVIHSLVQKMRTRASEGQFPVHCSAIFPSRFMQNLYTSSGFQFLNSTVIPHGINQAPHPNNAYRNRMFPVENGQLRLLFAGRVVEIKGVHTIVEALPEIIRKIPEKEIRLTVLGDCRDIQYLERIHGRIQKLDLEKIVTFQNPVSENELFDIFQDHDIFLFPSLYEPFSLTLIHALAAGIPTIASNTGGNTEIILPGKTGILFSKGDFRSLSQSVVHLAGDALCRLEVAAGGKKAAQSYTFQTMVQKVESYLNSV